ncbi:hypothetical protein BGW42_006034 [Actinomortierella wolfii]|nr:hypothetical protein BGW42_006034 [Actinomortierella wolfii]
MSIDTVPETYTTETSATAMLPSTTQQMLPESSLTDVHMSSPTRSSTPTVEFSAPLKATFVIPPSSDDAAQSYILSFRVPASHLAQFRTILQMSPDPLLVIPSKEHKKKERKRSIVLSSTVRSVSSTPTSAKGYVIASDPSSRLSTRSNMLRMQADEPDKDPETKMNELMQLKTLRNRQEDLCQLKDHLHQLSQALDDKEAVLEEMKSERKQLQNELAHYTAMIQQIQTDLDAATTAEQALTRERDQLATNLARIRDHDYDRLKLEVDSLRANHGLKPLPNLEQEREESIGRYLEERRGRWREEGGGDAQGAVAARSSSTTTVTSGVATATAAEGSTGEPASASSSLSSRQRNQASRSRENSRTRRPKTSGTGSNSSSSRQEHTSDGRRTTVSSSSSGSRNRRSRSRSPTYSRRNESSRRHRMG